MLYFPVEHDDVDRVCNLIGLWIWEFSPSLRLLYQLNQYHSHKLMVLSELAKLSPDCCVIPSCVCLCW